MIANFFGDRQYLHVLQVACRYPIGLDIFRIIQVRQTQYAPAAMRREIGVVADCIELVEELTEEQRETASDVRCRLSVLFDLRGAGSFAKRQYGRWIGFYWL